MVVSHLVLSLFPKRKIINTNRSISRHCPYLGTHSSLLYPPVLRLMSKIPDYHRHNTPGNENHIFPWQLSLHNFPFQQLHELGVCSFYLGFASCFVDDLTTQMIEYDEEILLLKFQDNDWKALWLIWIMIVVFHRCTLVRSGGLARQPRATQHQHQPNALTLI